MIRSCHHEVCCIRRRQTAEVFQSSWMSWSSKIIAVGTVRSSQRTSGSLQDSPYSSAYSAKSATWQSGRLRDVAGARRITSWVIGEVSSA